MKFLASLPFLNRNIQVCALDIIINIFLYSPSISASDLVKCERTYQNIGCFEEYNPQNLLLNERFNVRWGNIEAFIQQ